MQTLEIEEETFSWREKKYQLPTILRWWWCVQWTTIYILLFFVRFQSNLQSGLIMKSHLEQIWPRLGWSFWIAQNIRQLFENYTLNDKVAMSWLQWFAQSSFGRTVQLYLRKKRPFWSKVNGQWKQNTNVQHSGHATL